MRCGVGGVNLLTRSAVAVGASGAFLVACTNTPSTHVAASSSALPTPTANDLPASLPGGVWLAQVGSTDTVHFVSAGQSDLSIHLPCRAESSVILSPTTAAVLCQNGLLLRADARTRSAHEVNVIGPAAANLKVVTDFFVDKLFATPTELLVFAEYSPRPRAFYQAVVVHLDRASLAVTRTERYPSDVIQDAQIDPTTGRVLYLMGQGTLLDSRFHQLAPAVAGYAAFYLAIDAHGGRWISLQRNKIEAIKTPDGKVVKLPPGNNVQAIVPAGSSLLVIEAGSHPQISWLSEFGALLTSAPIAMQPITAALHGTVLGVLVSDDAQWRLVTVDVLAKRLHGSAMLPVGATKIA